MPTSGAQSCACVRKGSARSEPHAAVRHGATPAADPVPCSRGEPHTCVESRQRDQRCPIRRHSHRPYRITPSISRPIRRRWSVAMSGQSILAGGPVSQTSRPPVIRLGRRAVSPHFATPSHDCARYPRELTACEPRRHHSLYGGRRHSAPYEAAAVVARVAMLVTSPPGCAGARTKARAAQRPVLRALLPSPETPTTRRAWHFTRQCACGRGSGRHVNRPRHQAALVTLNVRVCHCVSRVSNPPIRRV